MDPPRRSSDLDSATLHLWDRRLRINKEQHNDAERAFARNNSILAIVTTLSLVILGLTASSVNLTGGAGKAVAISLAAIGGVASAMQSLLDYSAKAMAHRIAARQFAALRRALEVLAELPPESSEFQWRREEIRRQWDAVASGTPNVPDRFRQDAVRRNPRPS